MKLFQCQNCRNPVFFENNSCEKCGHYLGYVDSENKLFSLAPTLAAWVLDQKDQQAYRFCKNHEFNTCNWLVSANDQTGFCSACKLNKTIPNLENPKNLKKWRRIELAKHRLIFQLQQLGLPIISKITNEEVGFCFEFLSRKDATLEEAKTMMTGHANGLITILVSEADSVLREQMKLQMKERYRTLLGHFRHEVGHYYWERLIQIDNTQLENFRALFGDERASYAEALKNHYKNGAPKKWRETFISKYAASHPWEDWAETWSHYLHIMDTLETAYYFGLAAHPKLENMEYMGMNASFDPYRETNFKKIIRAAIPMFFSINSINRSMGIADIYPFVIPKPVIRKMKFIHNLLRAQRS